jgi:hypothetical protein
MSNINHDLPGSQPKPPTRLSVEQWDILEIERRRSQTQNKDKNQNKTMKVN